MKSKFIIDPQDPFGDGVNPADGGINSSFFLGSFSPGPFYPPAGHDGEGLSVGMSPSISSLTPTLPAESVEAQAAISDSGSGGTGSVVAETSSSGFTINLIFDAAAMASTTAAANFRAGIEQAASILSATITNKITVNLNIDYSGTGGGAAAGPDNGQYESYSTVRADLIGNAASGDTTFNALPTGSTIQGQSQVAVWNAQLKLFGLLGANDTTTDDGSATFATDISSSLLVGVALHELTHALGRVPYGAQSNGFTPDIFDFYRFTGPGARLFSDSIPASAAYFSVDGGNTKLADFGLYSDPSDFLNAANGALRGPYSNLTPNDAFNELYGSNTIQGLSAIDKQMLDALGFNLTAPALPDLSADFNAVSSTMITPGGSTSVDFWVVNYGKGAAAASTSGLYLSTDPTITTSDTLLTTVSSPALMSYGTTGYYDHQTVALTLPANLAPGTYYIGGIADYNNGVAESDTVAHNYNVTQITVPASALPDLSADFNAVSSTMITPGGSTSVDFWVVNYGKGAAAASTSGLYLSTDPTITTSDTLLTTVSSPALMSYGTTGYYDHQTVALTLPANLAPGTYYIGGIADYNNGVAESDTVAHNYNVTQITVPAPALPDLSADFNAVSSTMITPGGSTSVDFWVVNYGKGAAAASTSGLYLSTDPTITTSDTLLTTVSSPALMSYGTTGYYDHQTVALTLPANLAPGTYYIGGIADYNNGVAESDTVAHNYNVTQITVPASALPDLSADFNAVSSTMITPGGSTSVDFWVVNYGKGAAAASTSGLYLSTDPTITTSDTLLTTVSSPALMSYGTTGYYDHQTVALTLPANLAPGTYYIGGIADYNNGVAESDTVAHNYNVTQITVPAPTAPIVTSSATGMLVGEAAGNSYMGGAGSDTFVFKAGFGNETINDFRPRDDIIQFDHTIFASASSVIAHATDNGHGSAVISAASGDTLTIQNVTVAELQHHLSDFHIV